MKTIILVFNLTSTKRTLLQCKTTAVLLVSEINSLMSGEFIVTRAFAAEKHKEENIICQGSPEIYRKPRILQ
jgi:hypothetical protein